MFLSLLLVTGAAIPSSFPSDSPGDPTINLSAIREVECFKANGKPTGYGSGFIIAEDTLVTALHVVSGDVCKDVATNKTLIVYAKDPKHDLVLMTGDLPKKFPYIKYSCAGYTPNVLYAAYGYSGHSYGYEHENRIFRKYALRATSTVTDATFKVGNNPSPGMRQMQGRSAPGMSGSPIMDETGIAYGINNAGINFFNLFVSGPTWSYELKDTILCNKN
jgi:hypothetical protein